VDHKHAHDICWWWRGRWGFLRLKELPDGTIERLLFCSCTQQKIKCLHAFFSAQVLSLHTNFKLDLRVVVLAGLVGAKETRIVFALNQQKGRTGKTILAGDKHNPMYFTLIPEFSNSVSIPCTKLLSKYSVGGGGAYIRANIDCINGGAGGSGDVIIRYQHKCVMCESGKYRSAVDSKCLDCPIHSTPLQNSASMQDCKCSAGYQRPTNLVDQYVSCKECSAGYYSAGPWPSRLFMREGMVAVKNAERFAHEKTGLGVCS